MRPHFVKRDLELPARDEPLEDIDRRGVEIGAQEGLWLKFAKGIADQDPSNGQWGQAGMVPDGGAGGDLDGAIGAAIPERDGVALPDGGGVMQGLAELGQGLALDRWPPATPGAWAVRGHKGWHRGAIG